MQRQDISRLSRPGQVNNDLESLTELRQSLERVSLKKGNVWLLGDFNMPALDWTENTPMLKTDHTCTCKSVYEYFIDMINDFSLCQMVTEPTQQSNILDLFLTSNPTLIQRVSILPGLGDHDVV